jgi:hypothetical protein
MAIVAGFDVHRAQITFDALDTATGEVNRGRIGATPAAVGRWAKPFGGRELHVAVEACTGWLFVCDALVAAGGDDGIWPSRWRRARCVAANGARRPTARTRAGCAAVSRPWRRTHKVSRFSGLSGPVFRPNRSRRFRFMKQGRRP